MELSSLRTVIVTSAFTKRINTKEKGNIYGTMVHSIKETTTKDSDKELVNGNLQDRIAIFT